MRHRIGTVAAVASLLLLNSACSRPPEAPARAGAAKASPAGLEAHAPVEAADAESREKRPAASRAPVIWLGLDGLDWELLDRLAAEGRMPNWKRLAAEGASARLLSFVPMLSPIVWTTAATGVSPDKHRVLDFQEVDPKTGQKIPISGRSREVPAVWNLASAAGLRVGVVGWWATHPAEEVKGFFVSDHASPILYEKMPAAGVAYPAAVAGGVEQVVEREGRVTDAELSRLLGVPEREIAQARSSGAGMENPIVAMQRILAATRIYHRIARDLYDRERPDLLALYLEGTDQIGHVFASFLPPRLPCVSEADVARYGGAPAAYFGVVDEILGQWMRRAEEDGATLLVHSDHGFKWGSDRPCERSSSNWSTAAYWHRLEGVLVAWGGRAKERQPRGSASMFDIAPTILALLDLPADKRMTGRPAAAFFRNLGARPPQDLFASVSVRRVADEGISSKVASEYTRKLLALGYLSGSEAQPLAPTGGSRPGLTEGAWNNLGLYYRDTAHDAKAARAAFEKSLQLRPNYHSPMFNLGVLERSLGNWKAAEQWLFRSLEAGHADPEGTLLQWAVEYRREGKPQALVSLFERASRAYPQSEAMAREFGLQLFRDHDCPGAYAALGRFEASTTNPNTLSALGLFQTCLGHRDEAGRLFERSLAIKPDQPGVVQSLQILRAGPKHD